MQNRWLRKVSGLQEAFIDLESPVLEPEPKPESVPPKSEPIIQELNYPKPKVYEVFTMTDTTEITTNKRAVGVDIGTGFISCAEQTESNIEFRKVREAFFKLNPSKILEGSATNFGENMLKSSGAHYVKVDGLIYVLGDDAFKFASLFHQECLRPMSQGVLNPKQPVSNLMVGELVKAVAGRPTSDDDVLYYCVPAEPVDADFDVEYHKQILGGVFEDLGYKNVNVMPEGLAVVYS